jgi:hypothetical protein
MLTGKWAHCASCKSFNLSIWQTKASGRIEEERAKDAIVGNNIFEPKESPDMKEGEKGEAK